MRYLLVIIAFLYSSVSFAQKSKSDEKIPVLIRCDDIGMCHSVNVAAKEVLETGIPVSMSRNLEITWRANGLDTADGQAARQIERQGAR